MPHELDKILIEYDQPDFKKRFEEIRVAVIQATYFDDEKEKQLNVIFDEVSQRGDEAVADYTEKFDGVKLTPEQFKISEAELNDANKAIDRKLLKSIRQAIRNVKEYQSKIFVGKDKNFKSTGIKYTPIKRVGICVPGASAPLPSTVIMCAVPAQVAGVKEIVVVSPPRYNGSIHPVILATCKELKIKEVYRIGGAQAVFAMALGTKNILKVEKIVGPGNAWVQMAKKKVAGFTVSIDSVAGPSEVLIIANKNATPAWVAADMLSQAEHSPGSAVLFTDSEKIATNVLIEIKKQIEQLGRSKETVDCLLKCGAIVVFKNMADMVKSANYFAAEHLQIQCGKQSGQIAKKITNAGAIFIGDYSPVAVGDYWAGPSHTLPTGTTARFSSALSANDFIKATSIIEYDKKKLAASAEDIIRLAEAEGLDAHARSIRLRVGR
ncbi:MAG: histidinol dehydrogenase [Phycisphaerae bacterium]|nr:histidinol dehydrogenase [Phycisphaerae bacterium]MDD5380403.1 histidinol dehydrogenase [Phycisphaerae bacterium]